MLKGLGCSGLGRKGLGRKGFGYVAATIAVLAFSAAPDGSSAWAQRGDSAPAAPSAGGGDRGGGGGGGPPAAAAPSMRGGATAPSVGGGGGRSAGAPAGQPPSRGFAQPQRGPAMSGGRTDSARQGWDGRRGAHRFGHRHYGPRYGAWDDWGPSYSYYGAPPSYAYGHRRCHRHYRGGRVWWHCRPHGRWR